jgi:hypothetical protein
MIVGVHGIGNYPRARRQRSTEAAADELSARWAAALDEGLTAFTGHPATPGPRVRVAYYSYLLHRGTQQGEQDPGDLESGEQDLFTGWVDQLIRASAAPVPQGSRTYRARAAGEWLAGHLGDEVLGFALTFAREVSTYLNNGQRRHAVREAVGRVILEARPRILIAHSLGSVVAYETLWRHPELEIDLLVTLGSPLAMPGVIFPRLEPTPVNGHGSRPPGVAAWANLADVGDIVAIPRSGLAPFFDGVTRNEPAIHIDRKSFHRVEHYLRARETAQVLAPYIAEGLRSPS